MVGGRSGRPAPHRGQNRESTVTSSAADPVSLGSVRSGQSRDERLLGHLDPAHHLHPLLAFLLLLQQLALAGDVTAVALGEHVLADGPDRLAGDDARPDRGLDRHLELLPRDQLLQLGRDVDAVVVRLVLVHDGREGVHRLTVQQDVDLDQVGLLLAAGLVVQRRVPLGPALQLVEEVVDDLGHRQRVAQLDPVGRQVVHAEQVAPPALAQLHHRAHVVVRGEHGRPYHRLEDLGDPAGRVLARVGDGQLDRRPPGPRGRPRSARSR